MILPVQVEASSFGWAPLIPTPTPWPFVLLTFYAASSSEVPLCLTTGPQLGFILPNAMFRASGLDYKGFGFFRLLKKLWIVAWMCGELSSSEERHKWSGVIDIEFQPPVRWLEVQGFLQRPWKFPVLLSCILCIFSLLPLPFFSFSLIPTELTWEHLLSIALASLESPAVAPIQRDFYHWILPVHKCRERDPGLLRHFIAQSFLDLKYADSFGEMAFGIPNGFPIRLY